MDDMVKRGRSSAKLTEADVVAIRKDDESTSKALAIMFGVSEGMVHAVKNGTSWKHLPNAVKKNRIARGEKHCRTKLTEKDVLAIRESDKSRAELAEEYNVHWNTIDYITAGVTWKHVGGRRTKKGERVDGRRTKKGK